MFTKVGVFVACTLALAVSAQATTVTINFDAFADGTILPIGTFDPLGVHFDQNLVVDDGDSGGLSSSLPNHAINSDSFGDSVSGFFTGPATSVDFISVFAGDVGGDTDTVTLLGFNAANVLVDSDTFTAASAQTLSISGPGIVRFELNQIGAIAFDDFVFTFNNVPEPATATLGLLSLGALLMRRRRNA